MELLDGLLVKNGLVVAFATVALMMLLSEWLSGIFRSKIPASAIAILMGLLLAYIGGVWTGGKQGVADISVFSGFAVMGGSMFRDFAVVATAVGASFAEMRKAGWAGAVSLLLGISLSFLFGVALAWLFGFRAAEDLTTIGAGACTFIVGPVTGAAVGAESHVIAISIAAGVVKAIFVTIATPIVARWINLNHPAAAMVYGGLMGTTSGVAAGLAATDPRLVPYGAITATFYTGLGCLVCPSLFYLFVRAVTG